MILLEKYIKAYVKEAASTAISGRASDLTGKSHHQRAASYSNNMSEIDNQEALLKVLENVGNNCFISFVEKYDEKIPRLEVSPKVSYDTPHGNYAYPLTIKSLKDIVEKGSIGGANFAIERPYFHMFKKSNSLNSVEIKSDGSNNYSGNYEKDLRTIVHTAVMFNAARFLEKNPIKYDAPSDSDEEENRLINFGWTKRRIKRKISANTRKSEMNINSFYKLLHSLSEDLCYLVNLNNKKYPREVVELIVNFLVNTLKYNISSFHNKFFVRIQGKRKLLSKFHGLYYTCFMLAKGMSDDVDIFEDDDANAWDVNKINEPPENKVRQGSIFTMLLNSIDIDFINDKGSSTLHSSEPIQAVYLNSSKKENVVLIGTFNNIFKQNLQSERLSKNKSVTMNKIISILEKNPQLNNIFDSTLFDDVKLEDDAEFLRRKAWKELTKKQLKIAEFIHFHSTNSILNFNIHQSTANTSEKGMIIFDIGFKESFLNLDIDKQLVVIRDSIPNIVSIENNIDYISVFLSKYRNKDVYKIKDLSSLPNIVKTLNRLQNYSANSEINSEEEKKLIMSLHMFIYLVEDIFQIVSIAQNSTLNNSK